MSEYTEWLAGLREGDAVAWSKDYGRGYVLRKISRMTATQFVIDGEFSTERFRRDNGQRVGHNSRFDGNSLIRPTAEIVQRVKRARAMGEVSRIAWEGVPTETINAVLAIVRANKEND